MKKVDKKVSWDTVITPNSSTKLRDISEIIKYKDLIALLIKRDFTTYYKQTILGPLWYIIQPLLNTLVFTVIFGNFAKIPTDGVPPFIFYLAGSVVWSYFSTCVTTTSNVFVTNASLFSKVYFPRLCIPIANIIFSLMQFLIQFTFFLAFLTYFIFSGSEIEINFKYIFFTPILIFYLAIISFAVGSFISALCSKYRDLSLAIGFGIQLWMFATPIVYPLSVVPENYQFLISLNPVTFIVESFRFLYLGSGTVNLEIFLSSLSSTIIILFLGLYFFKKVEKTFIDTV